VAARRSGDGVALGMKLAAFGSGPSRHRLRSNECRAAMGGNATLFALQDHVKKACVSWIRHWRQLLLSSSTKRKPEERKSTILMLNKTYRGAARRLSCVG
jgi:hypothetical protein